MFITLLAVTFLIAALVCLVCVKLFSQPITRILDRIVADEISSAWVKYLKFAIYVVGISGGVRINQLERFINPSYNENDPLALTRDRWVLEIYRTIIQSLESIAGMLLVFFIFALIAYVIVRIFEWRRPQQGGPSTTG